MSLTIRLKKILVGLFCAGALSTAIAAETAREISWEQLVPAPSTALAEQIKTLQTEMDALTPEQQKIYFQIEDEMSLRARIDAGFIAADKLLPKEQEVLNPGSSVQHPQLHDLWQRVTAARKTISAEGNRVDPALNGTRVRLPGYVLPLEHAGSKIKEFLLVPYVGACIHVPPPPPNQMVFVATDEAFASESLYEAVWVEGVLSTKDGSHALSLVDGQADVSTGYSLQAVTVTPHQP